MTLLEVLISSLLGTMITISWFQSDTLILRHLTLKTDQLFIRSWYHSFQAQQDITSASFQKAINQEWLQTLAMHISDPQGSCLSHSTQPPCQICWSRHGRQCLAIRNS